jgi:hypothetical protein
MHIAWEHSDTLQYEECNKKIRSGKHHQTPYYFSSKQVLTINSESVCVTILQNGIPRISLKISVKKKEPSFSLTFFRYE